MPDYIVLLGDSIFDNGSYVPGEACVTEQLRDLFPDAVSVSMLAVDGYYTRDVITQVQKVPEAATHLIISAGGNDALSNYWTMMADFLSAEDMFEQWTKVKNEFRRDYRQMLEVVTDLNRHTAVCTIYDSVPGIEEAALTALSLFNDVIIAEASVHALPIVDLRRVCTEVDDYSAGSPIEPSAKGGAKIAAALHAFHAEHKFTSSRSVIYP